MIKINNFIEKDLQDSLESVVESHIFPWYYEEGTVLSYKDGDGALQFVLEQGHNPCQFTHNLVQHSKAVSSFFQLIDPITENIANHVQADIEIKRAKVNLLLKDSLDTHHCPHVDTDIINDPNIKTLVYYINETDGDTYIFNEKSPLVDRSVTLKERISPTKGSAIIFDADIFHSSSSPIIYKKRLVLNVVFKVIK